MVQTKLITAQDEFVHVQMTIPEFIEWKSKKEKPEKLIRKGLSGIMETFGCSRNTAFKIAHETWFEPCRIQMGKHIVFDANRAWELAKKAGF